MPKLRRIGLLSLTKFGAVVMTFVGLIAGMLYSFGGAIIDVLVTLRWITNDSTPGLSYGTALAFLALIGMPILFGVCGFLTGAIVAILFNLVAGWTGGIEIDIEQ